MFSFSQTGRRAAVSNTKIKTKITSPENTTHGSIKRKDKPNNAATVGFVPDRQRARQETHYSSIAFVPINAVDSADARYRNIAFVPINAVDSVNA